MGTLVEALRRFCDTVQLPDAEVKSADMPDVYALSITLTADRLKQARRGDYEALRDVFEGAIDVMIGDDPDHPILRIVQGHLPSDIDNCLMQVGKFSDGVPLRLRVRIDKSRILATRGLDSGPYHAMFLFFEQRLRALLCSDLATQDEELFAEPQRSTLIVVSDITYLYRGPLLVICGEADAQREAPLSPGPEMDIRLNRYRAFTAGPLNWSGFQLRRATPLHYRGTWVKTGPDDIQQCLRRTLLHMFILYTANRSTQSAPGAYEAVYANSDRALSLRLDESLVAPRFGSALEEIAGWPVDGDGTDRLTIIRSIAARSLDSGDALENYHRFPESLPLLAQEVRWQYQAFVDSKIDKHFEDVDKVADETAKTSKQVADAIDTITKGLSDTLLATIAAVVAALVAALLASRTDVAVFEIAMRVYAGYLAFITLYRMGSVWHGYRLLMSETEERFSRYVGQLGSERVADLRNPLDSRHQQFQFWFRLTAVLYIVLIGVVLWASVVVPKDLLKTNIVVPPTSSIPTATPSKRPDGIHARPSPVLSRPSRKATTVKK